MKNFVHIIGFERGFQGGRTVESFDLSVYHDGDTVAIFGLIHIMGGDKDGDIPFGRLIDQFPELTAG